MTDRSRALILNRRSAAIADLSKIDIEQFGITVDEAKKEGIYKVNAHAVVGIATSTEVGLSVDRYPIRVVLQARLTEAEDMATYTCVSYWTVANSAFQRLAFQRKPLTTEICVQNLYRYVPDFDRLMWEHIENRDQIAGDVKIDFDPNLNATTDAIYATLLLVQPTEEQKAELVTNINAIFSACTLAKRVAYFKIDRDHFIRGIPFGKSYVTVNNVDRDTAMLYEAMLTILVNRNQIKARHPTVDTGVISLAAYSIASMFRYGLVESYEHREFITVSVTPVANAAGRFTISGISGPPEFQAPASLNIGSELDITKVKLSPQLTQIGNCMVWLSGLMHYLYNHTTGSSKMTGPLLTVLTMYKFIHKDMQPAEIEEITSVIYEAIHPTNKRAIANIHFPTAKVYTHGKSRTMNRYEWFELDAFAAIRKTPYPAGSHKAYVCTQALKKVIQAGLAPFLPWAGELTSVVNMCKDVITLGARAHIGSSYYTGFPPISQASALDTYLPELAKFMQVFHPNDSLAASPHLSIEASAGASSNWTNLIKDVKAKDVSNANPDVVRAFLSTVGVGSFSFDPEDKSTWATAAATSDQALQVINNLFV